MVTVSIESTSPVEEPHVRLARMYQGNILPAGLLSLWGDMLQAAPTLKNRVRDVSRDEWHSSMATIPETGDSEAFTKEIEQWVDAGDGITAFSFLSYKFSERLRSEIGESLLTITQEEATASALHHLNELLSPKSLKQAWKSLKGLSQSIVALVKARAIPGIKLDKISPDLKLLAGAETRLTYEKQLVEAKKVGNLPSKDETRTFLQSGYQERLALYSELAQKNPQALRLLMRDIHNQSFQVWDELAKKDNGLASRLDNGYSKFTTHRVKSYNSPFNWFQILLMEDPSRKELEPKGISIIYTKLSDTGEIISLYNAEKLEASSPSVMITPTQQTSFSRIAMGLNDEWKAIMGEIEKIVAGGESEVLSLPDATGTVYNDQGVPVAQIMGDRNNENRLIFSTVTMVVINADASPNPENLITNTIKQATWNGHKHDTHYWLTQSQVSSLSIIGVPVPDYPGSIIPAVNMFVAKSALPIMELGNKLILYKAQSIVQRSKITDEEMALLIKNFVPESVAKRLEATDLSILYYAIGISLTRQPNGISWAKASNELDG